MDGNLSSCSRALFSHNAFVLLSHFSHCLLAVARLRRYSAEDALSKFSSAIVWHDAFIYISLAV